MAFAHITAKQPKCWPDNCLLIPFLSLVDVFTIADIDDENCVSNSLLQVWKLRFGHEAKLLFRLSIQGLKFVFSLALISYLNR